MKTFMIYRNNVERDTMMQEEIDNEHLICISAVAPVKPAKYNVLEIQEGGLHVSRTGVFYYHLKNI